jgi:hypothetical protein
MGYKAKKQQLVVLSAEATTPEQGRSEKKDEKAVFKNAHLRKPIGR